MKSNIFSEMKNSLESNVGIVINNRDYVASNGILKAHNTNKTEAQSQTEGVFSYKWKQENTYNSDQNFKRMKTWLLERYGSCDKWINKLSNKTPVILDAGCGSGFSGFEYWGEVLDKIEYVGVDISDAVEIARRRFKEKGFDSGLFMKESIDDLPFQNPIFDIIFSEGVMHHTDDTEKTFNHLCKFLKPKGYFMFYVYRKKGPIREFTDDYIREKIHRLSSEEAWKILEPLTQLGIELGKLDIEVNIPNEIELLDIPAGKINLQRLFYWHVFKAFYDPNMTFDEMNHTNFDWYAPRNAHRHTVEEVKAWCKSNQLKIKHLREEEAGITCIAEK